MSFANAARLETGRIKIHPDGFGFVTPDDGGDEIYVHGRARGGAMDGDRVEVGWWVGARGLEGRVQKVVERARHRITGQMESTGRALRLVPDDPRISTSVALEGGAGPARDGQAVVADIVHYPESPDDVMIVRVAKVLGDPDDPGTEAEKVLARADVDEEFPPDIERFAAHVPNEVRAADRLDRADLRHVPFTTIDPETARDFDDAVAIESLDGGGHRLWVAVADVSHYVREGQPIDVEAQKRGCSIYLPNRAIPMLPEPLSANICSLVPEEDRLAMVVRIDFDRNAERRDTDFMAAVIRSHARLDYPGVAAALDGDTRGKRKKYEPFLPALRTMASFAAKLRERRFARGALDLDLPEVKVLLDEDDPRRIRDVQQARKDEGEKRAYSMIEEFMLAANEAVGASFAARGEPTVWRVHDAPDEEKLETFATLAGRYGLAIDVEETRTPLGLGRALAQLKGHPAERALSFQLLRSLKQATYDVVNIGHFGLASREYLHFTSPIRRYPDVVVHRLLKRRLAEQGKPAGGFPALSATPEPPGHGAIARMAKDSSLRERKAMQIEREVLDAYRAFFVRDRIGDELEGTISGVTSFGLFVTTKDPFVEGLVRQADLPHDSYEFDPEALAVIGRRTGRRFALGDEVRAEIVNVSVAMRRIDFRLVEHHGTGRAETRKGASRRPGGRRVGSAEHDGKGTRQRARKKQERGAELARREGPKARVRGQEKRPTRAPRLEAEPLPRPNARALIGTRFDREEEKPSKRERRAFGVSGRVERPKLGVSTRGIARRGPGKPKGKGGPKRGGRKR